MSIDAVRPCPNCGTGMELDDDADEVFYDADGSTCLMPTYSCPSCGTSTALIVTVDGTVEAGTIENATEPLEITLDEEGGR